MKIDISNISSSNRRIRLIPRSNAVVNSLESDNPSVFIDEDNSISFCLLTQSLPSSYNVFFSSTPFSTEVVTEVPEDGICYLVISANNVPDGTVLNISYDNSTSTVTDEDFRDPPPIHDFLKGAFLIRDISGTLYDDNYFATRESDEIDIDYSSQQHSLWYKWVAPETASMVFSTENSSIDTVLGVYESSVETLPNFSDLTVLDENDDYSGRISKVFFEAIQGKVYYIGVAGYSSRKGEFVLSWKINTDG